MFIPLSIIQISIFLTVFTLTNIIFYIIYLHNKIIEYEQKLNIILKMQQDTILSPSNNSWIIYSIIGTVIVGGVIFILYITFFGGNDGSISFDQGKQMVVGLNDNLSNNNEKIIETITKQNMELNKNIVSLGYEKELQNIINNTNIFTEKIPQQNQDNFITKINSQYLIENPPVDNSLIEQINDNFLNNLPSF
jgi:hypothetical protein